MPCRGINGGSICDNQLHHMATSLARRLCFYPQNWRLWTQSLMAALHAAESVSMLLRNIAATGLKALAHPPAVPQALMAAPHTIPSASLTHKGALMAAKQVTMSTTSDALVLETNSQHPARQAQCHDPLSSPAASADGRTDDGSVRVQKTSPM